MANNSGLPVARRVSPAKGFDRNGRRRIVVEFDGDTFAQVAALAERDKVSFAEMVRVLVEWGLEA